MEQFPISLQWGYSKVLLQQNPINRKNTCIVERFAYKIVITMLTAIVQYVAVPKIILS